jgi:hypothetical protein
MQPSIGCGPNTMAMQKIKFYTDPFATCPVVPRGPLSVVYLMHLYPRSIALTSRAVWPVIVLIDNVCARHELQLGLLQNALGNLVPRIQKIHRA